MSAETPEIEPVAIPKGEPDAGHGAPGNDPDPTQGRRRRSRPVRVGEVLLGEGLVSEEQISKALAAQKSAGQKLGEVLVGCNSCHYDLRDKKRRQQKK